MELQPMICKHCQRNMLVSVEEQAIVPNTPSKFPIYVLYCPVHLDNKLKVYPEKVEYSQWRKESSAG